MGRALVAVVALAAMVACAQEDTGGADPGMGVSASSEYAPTTAQQADIVAALQMVFDALETGDAELLRSVMDPNVTMQSSGTNTSGETSFGSSTLDGLATRVETSAVPLIERMWDPVVGVSGSMATIWAPYDFYVGADFSHCGVDAATLMNREVGWKIISLSWTRLQPPACPLHPDGPPEH